MRPCGHKTVLDPLAEYVPGACRVCYLYWTDPKYRELWKEEEVKKPEPEPFRKPCNCTKPGGKLY